jgi:hypothetical protein
MVRPPKGTGEQIGRKNEDSEFLVKPGRECYRSDEQR